ncbi:Septin-domain-containing protein [Tribonema minus]|uniref:Septin-domain-containing protein n=1 Tax=Tribonema minus TaxID=303371 RepID=A0A835YRL2_9STRA|nr:Septin-domain-containing protein [Tribonema minus]
MQAAAAALWATGATPTPKQVGTYLVHMRDPKYRFDRMREMSNSKGNCGIHQASGKVVNYRIMLAGESGLGKTTMMNNLFSSYTDKPVGNKGKQFDKTRLEDFMKPELRVKLQESFQVVFPGPQCTQSTVNFFLQDTPGYGDDVNVMNSINMVADHAKDQHILWNKHVKATTSIGLMPDIQQDTRFDICLYFISPHRYRGIDVAYVAALAKYVNVVPIIAKSDTIFPSDLWDKYEADYGLKRPAAGVFACVSSPIEDQGSFLQMFGVPAAAWPTRQYAWGTAAVFNPSHSDTFALRIMLFEKGFTHVDESTERLYRNIVQDLHARTATGGGFSVWPWIGAFAAFLILMGLIGACTEGGQKRA